MVYVPFDLPMIDTSARSPPFAAGSIVTEFTSTGAPSGLCSQVPPLAFSISRPWAGNDGIDPLFLVIVAVTIPLSSVHDVPLSTTASSQRPAPGTPARSAAEHQEPNPHETYPSLPTPEHRHSHLYRTLCNRGIIYTL